MASNEDDTVLSPLSAGPSEQLRGGGDETQDKGAAQNKGSGAHDDPLTCRVPVSAAGSGEGSLAPGLCAPPAPRTGPKPLTKLPHTPHRKRPTHILEQCGEGTTSPTPH